MRTSAVTLILALLATLVRPAPAAQFFVAPYGSDAAPGTRARPFATPERARDAARAARARGERAAVVLRGGTYFLRAPLQLGAADSGTAAAPVVWQAAPGEVVRLSAARAVSGWRPVTDSDVRQRLEPAVRDRVREADLKAHGITDYGEMSGGFGKSGSTGLELFLDGAPMHIARYPNADFIPITAVLGATPTGGNGPPGTKEGVFRVSDPRVARWADEKAPCVLGYWFWDWADERQKVAKVDPQTLTLTLAPPWHGYGYRAGQYFYGFNLLCELDQPGEWYLDRDQGILYVLPPAPTPQQASVSVLPSVLTLDGASHVAFRHLVLEGARRDAVTMTGCEGCALVGCTVRNSGGWAVQVVGGHGCAVRGCDISGTGDGGVSLSGGDRRTLTPAGHVVENCHIHHYSRWDRTYRAGVSLSGVGCRASHNLIHDAPHQAMNLDGNDHLIEFNEIHNVCEETNDAGAIYAGQDWASRGNVIRGNYIHHIYGREARGANGVYLDDNFSSATIEGNVFEALVRPIHLGGGRDHRVLNNLFVDCFSALHIDARGLGWRAYGFDELKRKLELWPYTQPPWSVRYPALVNTLSDEPMAPKGIVVSHNVFIGSDWDDIEGRAKPYLTMTQNLWDGPRTLLQSRQGQMPSVDSTAPSVRAAGFRPFSSVGVGLYRSPDRASWPVSHPVTVRAWPGQKAASLSAHPAPLTLLTGGHT